MGRLIIDMTRCEGRGICVLLAPELLDLDRFGFPAMIGTVEGEGAERLARQAVRACPTKALSFLEVDEHQSAGAEGSA